MPANVKHLSADGATVITANPWPDAVAGQTQTPAKFGFENVGDRALINVLIAPTQVGVSDGSSTLRVIADTATLPKPWGLTATLLGSSTSGVWLSTGTKGFKITALNATGETVGSEEATVNVDVANKPVALAWQPVPSATGYKVYDTDTPGTYPAASLRATLGAVTSYNDLGGARSTGTPPASNTTAGWFSPVVLGGTGSGGVWASVGARFWRVSAEDATAVILAASFEATVTVDATSKKVTLSWAAIPGAVLYKLYRSALSGTYASPALVGQTAGLTLDDLGAALLTGTLTATPSYGIPPAAGSFGTAAILTGTSMPINQQIFYWVNRVIPVSTAEAGNPRLASITIKES